MASATVVSVFFGLVVGTILYFIYRNNEERCHTSYAYNHNYPSSGVIDNGETCPICKEILSYEAACTFKCKHQYHKRCIEQWMRTCFSQSNSPVKCPICRQNLE